MERRIKRNRIRGVGLLNKLGNLIFFSFGIEGGGF